MSTSVSHLAILEEVYRHPLASAASPAAQQRYAGVVCTYAPGELLHAAGLTPIRLHVPGQADAAADSWLPPFTCSVVRGILGAALAGQVDSLSCIVLPHACDSVQELAGIWQALRPRQALFTLVEPVAVAGPHAARYLRHELRALAGRLAVHTGQPVRDEDLGASLALYNRVRRALQRLDALAGAAGRSPTSIVRTLMNGVVVGRTWAELEQRARRMGELAPDLAPLSPRAIIDRLVADWHWWVGTPEAVADQVAEALGTGIHQVLFQVFDFRDLAAVDLLAREVLPRLRPPNP